MNSNHWFSRSKGVKLWTDGTPEYNLTPSPVCVCVSGGEGILITCEYNLLIIIICSCSITYEHHIWFNICIVLYPFWHLGHIWRIDGKMHDERSSRSIGKEITTLFTCTICSVPVPVTGTCSITIYIYTTGSIIFTRIVNTWRNWKIKGIKIKMWP